MESCEHNWTESDKCPLCLIKTTGNKSASVIGLVGLTLDDIRCIREALSLMNCMILGGEKHTLKSEKILYEALQALRKAN